MAVPIRTAVAALCAGLVAALFTTVPARAVPNEQSKQNVWAVSVAAHAPRARNPWTTPPAR
jgi:alpha-glucosidase